MSDVRPRLLAAIALAFAGCVEAADGGVIAAPDRIAGCTETALAPDARLAGVWIAPGGAVWAVGRGGLVGRRGAAVDDGWQWCTAGGGADLAAIWGAADDDVWIAGAAGTVLRWRGAAFERVELGTTADLSDVWGAGPSSVFVVGDRGVARHFDGATWAVADVLVDELGAVWGANATDVWTGGHRRTTTTTPGGGKLNGCTASLHRWRPTTRTFTLEQAFAQEHGACGIHGLGGSGAADVWAVGTEFPAGAAASFAFAAHRDGAGWSRATPPDEELTIDRTYTDVVARAPGAEDGLWVAATGISAVRRTASAWSPADASTADLLDLDARDGRMFAVGAGAKILRWSATSWIRE